MQKYLAVVKEGIALAGKKITGTLNTQRGFNLVLLNDVVVKYCIFKECHY